MSTEILLFLIATGLGVLGWLLHQVGQVLLKLLEAAAVIAGVFAAIWLAIRTTWKAGRWVATHWRSTVAVVAVAIWLHLLGWPSLAITVAAVAAVLATWRAIHVASFEPWAGRYLRAWWLRWALYARNMPRWFRACRLSVPDGDQAISLQLSLLRRTPMAPRTKPRPDQLPRITGVRSGPSWDEVRVRLIPGQTPEDFDEAARSLAVARGVRRCQIRELAPDVVSIDFQRRDLLTDTVSCLDLATMADVEGKSVDLNRAWAGRTEYGTDWRVPIRGGHTLTCGATGAGKNSVGWSPLVSIAPAIRDGLVRVSAIDPKGMELAYGRRIFHRYAVTSKDAVALLDDVIEQMEARKEVHAGRVRTVEISTDTPLEVIEFDEIGALTKYIGDRKTREQIIDRVALITTQGRALGFTMRGYVQEPTKDTVPVRDLFPRRICLRVATKSHVAMALGDNAWDRGAWANRIGESEAGVGYLFGEGIREPLRVRAGWVPDETIKALEEFVTRPAVVDGQVITLPAPAALPVGGAA
jgi:DNA segregation ATPase FtsK/SpoIIIE, S-DNA-T family